MKELNIFCFAVNLIVIAFVGLLMALMPSITQKTLLFGVRVPPQEAACLQARTLIRRYRLVCVISAVCVFIACITQFAVAPDFTVLGSLYYPLLILAAQMAAYIPAWKAAKRLKEEKGWQVSAALYADTQSSYSRGQIRSMPWFWYLAALAIAFASAIIELIEYPNLPAQIPSHFGINMEPDAWSDKSIGLALSMPLINIGTAVCMFVAGLIFHKAKLQLNTADPALSFAQHSAYRRLMGNWLGFYTLCLSVSFFLMGLSALYWQSFKLPFWLSMVLDFAPLLPLCTAAIRAGQSGSKLKPKNYSSEGMAKRNTFSTDSVRSDDDLWVLGMFYYNPDDPTALIEDRFGSGVGFNYARASVKAGVSALTLSVIAVYIWISTWVMRLIAL